MIQGVFFLLPYFYCTCPGPFADVWLFDIVLELVVCFIFCFACLSSFVLGTSCTLGGWAVCYFVDSYPCFFFTCQEFFSYSTCVRIWASLYSLLCDICLLNACTVALAWLYFMFFWFRCMFGYDLGNFVSMSLQPDEPTLAVFVDSPFWACIPFHCSIAHYKPLAWKTMIHPALGNFGDLELFWE